ncbi:MAG: tRNA pseudouridine synthase A [Dehalococcoidia bacterium]
MRWLALLLEYDGAGFAGSQLQPGRRTVQGTLEEAIEGLTGEQVRAALAGRTDAGVHALGQVAAVSIGTMSVASRLDPDAVLRALNHRLPEDVAVRAVADVEVGFDPRRMATGRTYRYTIRHGTPRSPLARSREWLRGGTLDVEAMARAAALLPRERRDWAAFAGRVPDGYTTMRTLRRCEVQGAGAHRVVVTMEADAFLPHQVRLTVGALARVGSGRLEPEAFAALVDGAPGSAGPSAPPQGLVLCSVEYPSGLLRWARGSGNAPSEEGRE